MRVFVATAALALVATPDLALAQSHQCTLPQGHPSVPPVTRGPERRARVTGYTLAASWSPEYCRAHKSDRAEAWQCSGRAGSFGMILHGLWPEGLRASPQWCGPPRAPLGDDLRANLCVTPSARLLAHEWAKHGSCMVNRPATYFKIERILWDSLRWPDYDALSRRRNLTAGDIRRAFADANPSWRPRDVGLEISPRGWLEGIRLCYGTDFLPRPCPQSRLGSPDKAKVSIWRGL